MSEVLFQTVNIKNQDIVWLNIPKGLVYFKNKRIGDGVGNNGELFQGYIGYGTKNQKNCVVKKFPIPQEYAYLSEENIELILGKKLAHKNIVEFYECNKSQYNYYLFMEYCSGGSLQQLINIPGQEDNYFYNKPLEEKQTLDIMSQILDALIYMKNFQINDAKGCFHRDIKPDNIMFDAQGRAKLIDFGMGKFKSSRIQTFFKGSPIYMSPQNLSEQQYDLEKNDVWSFGIILYQLLEGQFPWRKELASLDDLKEAQTLLKNSDLIKFDHASPGLQKLIKFMLKYNEKDRATFDDVKNSEPFTTYLNQDSDQTSKIQILLSNYDYYKSLQTLLQFQNFDKLVLDLILLEINKLKNNIIRNSNLEVRVINLYNDRIFQKRKNYSFKRPQYLKDKLQRKLTTLIQTIIINNENIPMKDLRDFCSIIIKLYNPELELEQKIGSFEELLKFARQ